MSDVAVVDEFKELLRKTNKTDPAEADVLALRVFLRRRPHMWKAGGDLVQQAALQLIRGTGGPAIMRESLEKGWDVLRNELGYREAPPLERLLIDQVGLCWLRHNMLELMYTSAINEGMTVGRGDLLNRRLAASQRRYLRACETLARVRKMVRTTPALQVNIATAGGQQVNVATTI